MHVSAAYDVASQTALFNQTWYDFPAAPDVGGTGVRHSVAIRELTGWFPTVLKALHAACP